jgi:poly(A) polymerase
VAACAHWWGYRYTFDPHRNALAAITTSSGRSNRIDRIFVRSPGCWRPSAVDLICTEPLQSSSAGEGQLLFPSDHFGLKAVIEFTAPLGAVAKRLTGDGEEEAEEEEPVYVELTREERIALRPQLRTMHSTAVVVVPPRKLWPALQNIRKVRPRVVHFSL